jgi:3-oxoacyl-(acyl-carrier-protein) synthase
LALWEALRLLAAGRAERVLVVGVDELSPYAITAGQEYGWWRRDAAPLAPMAAGGPPGTLPGEGAAALLLGRAGSHGPRIAAIRVRPLPDPDFRRVNPEAEVEFIRGALDAAGKTLDGVDLFLFGANGDPRLDAVYAEVARVLGGLCGVYKHLCGEFCTAPAVGVALAARSVRDGRLAPEISLPKAFHEWHRREGMSPGYPPEGAIREWPSGGSVAVYHLHEAGYHSICLVTG